ncbi:neutral zinc metallopeptidase [Mycobacterium sp. 663a-19]|uniref:KPN_02809 family neutral zinc metallopeptidase n=1 Tax=Mycobacterium sp. 663a-19 TaxID=2986148 RepID=UPI002D1E67E5|nr:neutral zinc metallopeptidase [Mycobacterium sp. 663a-19]MEB3984129.1 neutral zinc metallopeptidase [Mycobacterium sp. 663a-19]
MTFNEGMQIDTSTASSSGGGGMGMAIGGGGVGLLILIGALLLGVDPGRVLNSQQMNTGGYSAPGFDLSQCKTGADANKYVQCRVVATGNSVDAVWHQLLQGYTRPRVRLFSDQVSTGCGMATTDVGPFYCPVDQTAYFDTTFFQDVLVRQLHSSNGAFAQEYVVAHEYGHHVQNLQGVLGRAQQGAKGAGGGGVRTELQADCYAGIWAHYASTVKQQDGTPFLNPLSDQDIADALSAAASVGDDRIQRQSTGRVNPESWTHGSAAERQHWFTVGYQTGDPKQCDTFHAADLG